MFKVIGPIGDVETIATGKAIRELARLHKVYGRGRWRKRRVLVESDFKMAASTSRKSTGTKRTVSVPRSTRSSASSREPRGRFVVCVSNDGYAASLEVRKIYTAIRDASAEKLNMIRVVDESGEDYLYPRDQFTDIALPPGLAKALAT